MPLGEKPIIVHTIEKFLLNDKFDKIYVGVHADWLLHMSDLLKKYSLADERIELVRGGKDRTESILNIIKKIENDEWKTAADESCCIDQIEFENLIKDVKKEYGSGFSKNYREMPEGEFVKSVIDEMEVWMFIRKDEADHQIKICPLTGKIQGSYPADYMGGRNDE